LVIREFQSQLTHRPRQYALYVPPDYNDSPRRWPLILFLHGAGERGDDVQLLLKHGPLKEALLRKDFPFLVVAPHCPAPQAGAPSLSITWTDAAGDALAALADVEAHYRVDPTRIYLTGLSLGGFGSFYLAAEHPGRFAAVAPICGGGEAARVKAYEGTPFWIFHGMQDRVVPPNRSVEMADTMRAFGQDVKLTTYPDLGHDAWTVTYENDELYAWFLSHRRPKKD